MPAVTEPEQLGFERDAAPAVRRDAVPAERVLDCPRRYRLTYLDRPTPAGARPGRTTRSARSCTRAAPLVAAVLTRADAGRRRAAASTRNWQSDGFRDDAAVGVLARPARALGRALPGRDRSGRRAGRGRAHGRCHDRSGWQLSGRVDRIDDRGGELVIVDYKTGRKEPDRRRCPRLAGAGPVRTGARADACAATCRRVELHHLPTGRVAAWEHTEESLARQVARAEATADDIVAATDTLASGARPRRGVPACPDAELLVVRLPPALPEGQAASPSLDSWAGLAQDGRDVT